MKNRNDKPTAQARSSRHNAATNWRAAMLAIGLSVIFGATIVMWSGRTQAAAEQRRIASGDTLWQDVPEDSIPNKAGRRIIPTAYRTLELNMEALKRQLDRAPMEFSQAARSSPLEVTMPLPDGRLARFGVVEARMMEPRLATQFPEIKNYRGYGIDERQSTIGFNVTPAGFHAFILGSAGPVEIEPFMKGDTAHYISYYKQDDTSARNWTCAVKDSAKAETRRSAITSPNFSSGEFLRIYRLAVAATGEWTAVYGSDPISALVAINTRVMGVNVIFEREVGIRMVLIANELDIIYFDANTDPYPHGGGQSPDAIIFENGDNLAVTIGSDNFDIGQVYDTGNVGLATRGTVCLEAAKGRAVSATNDVLLAAHETGHQFGATHTFNDNMNGACLSLNGSNQRKPETAFEPASGSTIMSYGGNCNPANLQTGQDSYFHANSIFDIEAFTGFDAGDDCAVLAPLFNAPPLLDPVPQIIHIPALTPFVLNANATDADNDQLTYTWEQYDAGAASPPEGDDGTRAIFRSYPPSINSARVFPNMQYILNNGNNPPATYMNNNGISSCTWPSCVTGEVLPSTNREMHFVVTVRDGRGGIAQNAAISVFTHNDGGPFRVTQPNAAVAWTKGSTQTITWDVAFTNSAPISCPNVRITLSTNGGESFPFVLTESTANDGSQSLILPDVETTQARIRIEAVGNIFFDISDTDFIIKPIVVTTTSDNGNNSAPLPNSLREAIKAANNLPGVQTIRFNLPGAPFSAAIGLTAALPLITDPVIIDGWSQGGPGYEGGPLVILNGVNASPAHGLVIAAGDCTIRGLHIDSFTGTGILIQTKGGNSIYGCWVSTSSGGGDGITIFNTPNNEIGRLQPNADNHIAFNNAGVLITGLNATGNRVMNNIIAGNRSDGIRIVDAPANVIGGTRNEGGILLPTRNVISGNGNSGGVADGIEITGANAIGNMILGNYIGLDEAGVTAYGNLGSGIRIENAPNTIIGGTSAAARNVIADNRNQGGISLIGAGSTGTIIQGNYLGIDKTGNVAIPNNATNIYVESSNNTIGGTAAGAGNVISGFKTVGGKGIYVFGGANNFIQGNYIGTNADGTSALNNVGTGIEVRGNDNLIGGTTASARNVISGNATAINVISSNRATIQANYVGTNPTGTAAVSNGDGIAINGGSNHQIGGTVGASGNVISGNNGGAVIVGNSSGVIIQGNRIGTNSAGTTALRNFIGVQVVNSTNTQVGGTLAAARNIISANSSLGINISGGTGTVVQGNYIGTDVNGTANLGNGQTLGSAGIQIESGSHTIGGPNSGEGNIIAFSGCFCFGNNFGHGIDILSFSSRNRIRGNSIFGNAQLGINLQGGTENAFAVTANDSCDADNGANALQNYPVLTSSGSAAGTTVITGTLNSNAGSTVAIDFYSNPSCDSSGNGEGSSYLGSFNTTTDGSCNTSFAVTFPVSIPAGQTITATATDSAGNTSEFSACSTVVSGNSIPAGNYSNLVINAGTTMTLSGDITVFGTLTLNGDLNTGPFTLTMPASANSIGTGDVIGNVRRTGITIGATLTLGNPFNTIRFDSGTPPTEVTVNLVKSAPPGFSNAVTRTYTITPLGGAGYSATLQLHYQDSDLNGNNEATLQLWRNNGTAWAGQGATTRDAIDNWIRLTGVTQFSPWTIAGPDGPTEVKLIGFSATSYDNGVLLEWQTGLEVDNLGFRIYRDSGGKRSLVNTEVVAGSALVAATGATLTAGRSYVWWDGGGDAETRGRGDGATYWLEDIDLNGSSNWHGPFFVKQLGGKPPERSQAPLLSNIGTPDGDTTRIVEPAAATSSVSREAIRSTIAPRFDLASLPAAKISVRQTGWYRITQPELISAGFDTRVDPRLLRLFVDGKELPIEVTGEVDGRFDSGEVDGRFDSDDAVGFFGISLDTPQTDARIYWLAAGSQPGLRIADAPSVKGHQGASSFAGTVERRDRSVYFSALRNGDAENFFGSIVSSASVDQAITLTSVAPATDQVATIAVALQGVTNTSHQVGVQLNGSWIGTITFIGQATGRATFEVAHSALREGVNVIHLTSQAGPSDISMVDTIRVTYQRNYLADRDSLSFIASGGVTTSIDGFASKDIHVFDVTNDQDVKQLPASVDQSRLGYSVTFTPAFPGERKLIAFTDTAARRASISLNRPSSLRSANNSADFIIVTHASLVDSFKALSDLRSRQGLRTAIVDVEDIYDEFSFGSKSVQSIKDFLSYASTSWKVKPRFVLLAGDSSYDPRNYLGYGFNDLVPTKLIDTAYLETASDDWLADFTGDGVADLVIGRLPVRSAREASGVVNKIVNYDGAAPSNETALVADSNDGFDFELASTTLRPLIPSSIRVTQIYRSRSDDAHTRLALLAAINRGQKVVNYVGHGSVNVWRGDLLTSSDGSLLTNRDRLSLFLMMTCLNGYFHDAAFESLGESLLKSENGGAIAVWASSALCLPQEQASMNQTFYRLLFSPDTRNLTVGEIVRQAKGGVVDPDIRRSWILFGDPTMRVK